MNSHLNNEINVRKAFLLPLHKNEDIETRFRELLTYPRTHIINQGTETRMRLQV